MLCADRLSFTGETAAQLRLRIRTLEAMTRTATGAIVCSVAFLCGQRVWAAAARDVLLATTTSTQDSGLLDVLVPLFEKKTGYRVKTLAVGTGQALKMGERGDVDVLLVHAPEAELKFVKDGHSSDRRLVMHNGFVIVGPGSDPANVKKASSAPEALKRIAVRRVAFLSRGDESGTHAIERKLWRKAKVQPQGDWYQQSGQGMGATLRIASEKSAYTLTDRATFLALRKNLDLAVLYQKDPALLNVYHVLVVNAGQHPNINVAGARAFADFLTARETQRTIGRFGVERFGEPLFFPNAGRKERPR